jgi:CheY-like chemotaxis protein
MKSVLYADDDGDDVFFMRRAFDQHGTEARLFTVKNGADAVAYLSGEGKYTNRAEHPLPQLVLLDLKMPVMDGFDVLKWIRGTPAVSSLPVIVLTSSANESDRSRAALLGANGYLVKPGRPDKLEDLVRVFKQYWLEYDRLADEKPVPRSLT